MYKTRIVLDLAQNVFQPHGSSMTRQFKVCKTVTRLQFRQFISDRSGGKDRFGGLCKGHVMLTFDDWW